MLCISSLSCTMNFKLRNVGLEIAFTTKLREVMKCTKDFVSSWSDSKISYWHVQEVMGSMRDKFGCNCSRRKNLQLWELRGRKLYWWQMWGRCFPFLVQFLEKFGWCNFIHLTYFGEQFQMRLGFFEIVGIFHKDNQLTHENKVGKCWSLKAHNINFLCLLSKVMTYIKFKCRSLPCIISQIEFGSLFFCWQLFQLSKYFLGILLLHLDKWGSHHMIVRVFFNVG
jgi:hypothetical protein